MRTLVNKGESNEAEKSDAGAKALIAAAYVNIVAVACAQRPTLIASRAFSVPGGNLPGFEALGHKAGSVAVNRIAHQDG